MFNRDVLSGSGKESPSPQEPGNRQPAASAAAHSAERALPMRSYAPVPPASPAPAATPAPEGASLVVGPNIKMRGEVEDCDTLIVEGHVDATLDTRLIRVMKGGVFSGAVNVDTANIEGRFDGEMTVRGTLTIASTGKVSGTIRYAKLRIEEGGELTGTIETLSAAAGASSLSAPALTSPPAPILAPPVSTKH